MKRRKKKMCRYANHIVRFKNKHYGKILKYVFLICRTNKIFSIIHNLCICIRFFLFFFFLTIIDFSRFDEPSGVKFFEQEHHDKQQRNGFKKNHFLIISL